MFQTPFPFTSSSNWIIGIQKTQKEFLWVCVWSREFVHLLTSAGVVFRLTQCIQKTHLWNRVSPLLPPHNLWFGFRVHRSKHIKYITEHHSLMIYWAAFSKLYSRSHSVNVIKDLKVSTGAIQMLPYSHRADRVLCQHPWFHFYKNVCLCSELLFIVFSGDSTGKEWHISCKLARGAGFLLRDILFIRGIVGHTYWQLFLIYLSDRQKQPYCMDSCICGCVLFCSSCRNNGSFESLTNVLWPSTNPKFPNTWSI